MWQKQTGCYLVKKVILLYRYVLLWHMWSLHQQGSKN